MTIQEKLFSIPIEGTPEHAKELNNRLRQDLAIYATRPFLNGQERRDLGEYFCTWSRNNLIALMNFDKQGNFLPQVYQAPRDYLNMLYPIDELMSYDKQGTLIIDREQYSPELRNLSFFIYMVDEELYDQYKEIQRFNGPTCPTFMFNKYANNGVRIFRDWFALARHLRKSRTLTYILGPRSMFYLRYFLYQIHIHTVDENYAYGERVDGSLANETVESIKRHLAFNAKCAEFTYVKDITVDNYKEYRALYKALSSNEELKIKLKHALPDVQKFHSETQIVRYQKQTLHSLRIMHTKKNKSNKYRELYGIEDYCNMMYIGGYAVFFIWDTRRIMATVPVKVSDVEVTNPDGTKEIVTKAINDDGFDSKDFTSVKWDNRMDLVCKADSTPELRTICEQLRVGTAIQMRD